MSQMRVGIDVDDPARPPRFQSAVDDIFAKVLEGACPHGHGPLERRDECGWCSTCRLGYSVRGRTVWIEGAGRVYVPAVGPAHFDFKL